MLKSRTKRGENVTKEGEYFKDIAWWWPEIEQWLATWKSGEKKGEENGQIIIIVENMRQFRAEGSSVPGVTRKSNLANQTLISD